MSNSQPNQQVEALRKYRDRGDKNSGITELNLLKEITFAFANVESDLIIFGEDHYSLRPTVKVSETVRKIVKELSDIGWLYGKINDRNEEEGVIRKSLRIAVHEEMK